VSEFCSHVKKIPDSKPNLFTSSLYEHAAAVLKLIKLLPIHKHINVLFTPELHDGRHGL
jgi:hypothetical protein